MLLALLAPVDFSVFFLPATNPDCKLEPDWVALSDGATDPEMEEGDKFALDCVCANGTRTAHATKPAKTTLRNQTMSPNQILRCLRNEILTEGGATSSNTGTCQEGNCIPVKHKSYN